MASVHTGVGTVKTKPGVEIAAAGTLHQGGRARRRVTCLLGMISPGAGKGKEGEVAGAEDCCTGALMMQVRLSPERVPAEHLSPALIDDISGPASRPANCWLRGLQSRAEGLCGSELYICALHPLLQMLATSPCISRVAGLPVTSWRHRRRQRGVAGSNYRGQDPCSLECYPVPSSRLSRSFVC